ncbi:MAG: translocation/assembly module TamB domain-containing protein, partial [Flavobacteriales bacterium]|nr:translocation/assembly module TamB domain-containing protein [Flavobacteriales bacterium]
MLLVFLLVLVALYGAFRTSAVQTYVTRKVAQNLSERMNTVIDVQGVDIAFFNHLILEGLYIEDLHQDTLLYIAKLSFSLETYNGELKELLFDELILNRGVINIRKYMGEEDLNFKFIVDEFAGSDTTKMGWLLKIKTTDLREISFSYVDENREPTDRLMDFKDLHVSSFSAFLKDTKLDGDSVWSEVEALALKEQSGFEIENLVGDIKTSPVGLSAMNLNIVTPHSNVSGELNFSYSGYGDYQYFIDSIEIESRLEETKVNLEDISYFVPAFKGLDDQVIFTGGVRGRISRLKGKNIDMTYGTDTRFRGNLSLNGLPNFQETFIRFRVKEFSTSQRDLAKLPVPPFSSGKTWNVPPYVRNLGNFNFIGDFTGFYNDFVAYGECRTAIGKLSSDLSLSYDPAIDMVHYEGEISSSSFDVGRLFDAEKNIGIAAFDIHISGDGLDKNTARAELDGLVKGITLKDYYYQNVELKGELANRRFSGYMGAKDENLDFVFNGTIDYATSPPLFNFTSDIAGANLDKLNLAPKLKNPVFSVKVESNFSGTTIDDLQGEIQLLDLKYRDEKIKEVDEYYPIGNISLVATEILGERDLRLKSDIVDVDLKGRFNIRDFTGSLMEMLHEMLPNSEHMNHLTEANLERMSSQDFDYDIKVKDGDKILSIFYPTLSIAPQTHLSGTFSSDSKKFEAKLKSNKVKIRGIVFEEVDWTVLLFPDTDTTLGSESAMKLHSLASIGKFSPSPKIALLDLDVNVDGRTNELDFATSWDNKVLPSNKGSVVGTVQFDKGENGKEILLKLQPTEITVADTLWSIFGNNSVRYSSQLLDITDLQISNAIQEFKIDGSNSAEGSDGIDIVLSNFEIAAFEPLINSDKLSLEGLASGKATIYGIYSNPYATGNIEIKELTLNEAPLGNASFSSVWKKGAERVTLSGSIVKGQLEIFSLLANYQMTDGREEKGAYSADIGFNKFRLKPFESFVTNVFSRISDKSALSGSLKLTGSGTQPVILGKVNLQRGGFTLANLNTDYTLADEFLFTENSITFDKTVINDMKGHRAVATGKIIHKYFKDWSLDIDIEADNVHSLNTDLEYNDLYHGQAFATGSIKISGPFDEISIEVAITTNKNTQLNIPLTTAGELDENAYITFINGAEEVAEDLKEPEKVGASFPQIIMNIESTEDAEVKVIFDETVGDVLKVNGRGGIQFKVDRDGAFNMYGTYEIRKGDYLFTLSGIINKRFI